MENIKTLIIFRGLPGSGKTTAAELMAGNEFKVRSADDYFYENGPDDGKYNFDPTKLGNAHGQCKYKVEADMKKGNEKVFVANTFTTQKELNPYLKMAEENGYRSTVLIVENRHANKSIHNVPDEVSDKMEGRFSIKLR